MTNNCILVDEAATLAYGAKWAEILKSSTQNPPWIIFLKGDLGAGKTTLVRGFVRAMGYKGTVKSPTYTLVESYECHDSTMYHFDLYRIDDPARLDMIGIKDYCTHPGLLWIEWPEQGQGFLPAPDMMITLTVVPEGRALGLALLSKRAQALDV